MITKGKLEYIIRRSKQKAWHIIEDIYRSSRQNVSESTIVNDQEIRVVGLRRSGNHAIINWIRNQAPENTTFINHTRIKGNPYRDVHDDQMFLQRNPELKGWRCDNVDWWRQEAKGDFSHKDCLIYSYEDQEIERVVHPAFEERHDLYLGQSAKRHDIIIMRDPFNLFASRFKGNRRRAKARNFDLMSVYSKTRNLPELWVSYAKECLGETNLLPHNKTCISYNQWFTDVAYRKSIAEKLNIEFSDAGFEEVVRAGGIGSSFDGTSFNSNADQMDVLNRWQSFAENEAYLELLKTPQLIKYSTQLFGHLPGTEVLIEKIK
ncbi:MAG: hypothetical protein AAFQ63_10955 [Cyanobacteria bacterium J06621_11]